MAATVNSALHHQLDFLLYDLPATTVRIDFPAEAGAELLLHFVVATVQIGAGYMPSALGINSLSIQPRRIQFEIASPPPVLPVSLRIACPGGFTFGWLQVPETVQTVIATTSERIRIVGPSYWALPLDEGLALPEITRRPASRAESGSKPPSASAREEVAASGAAARAASSSGSLQPLPNPSGEKTPENKSAENKQGVENKQADRGAAARTGGAPVRMTTNTAAS